MSYIGNRPLTRAEKKTQQHNVSEGQTDFNVSGGYTVGLIDVFLNGVLLLDGIDYIAANGTSIDLAIETKEGDTLVTIAWGTFVTAAIANKVDNGDPRLATAWCVFDGTLTGTNAPIDGFNVASVTRDAAGTYTVNFIDPLDNVNYCQICSSTSLAGTSAIGFQKNVDSTRVYSYNTSGTLSDQTEVNFLIFGGKD